MKLTNNEICLLRNRKKIPFHQKLLLTWQIVGEDDELVCRMRWPFFIILYIPMAIIQFFFEAWNYGISGYTLPKNKFNGCEYITDWEKELLEDYRFSTKMVGVEVDPLIFRINYVEKHMPW